MNMRHRSGTLAALFAIAAACLFTACGAKNESAVTASTASIALFNGKDLSGWTAIGKGVSADEAAKTWGVANGVITDTGKPNGYLRTTKRYANYRLVVEWRWPNSASLDANGQPKPRNSGVILHMQGEDAVWPKSIEAQLREGDAGDFWVIGGVETNEHTASRAKAVAAAGDDAAAKKKAATSRRLIKNNPSSEKPGGEWNRYEIVCRGDTITLSINGVEQNRVTGVTVNEGHICLQAEGSPVEFRNIVLTPLD